MSASKPPAESKGLFMQSYVDTLFDSKGFGVQHPRFVQENNFPNKMDQYHKCPICRGSCVNYAYSFLSEDVCGEAPDKLKCVCCGTWEIFGEEALPFYAGEKHRLQPRACYPMPCGHGPLCRECAEFGFGLVPQEMYYVSITKRMKERLLARLNQAENTVAEQQKQLRGARAAYQSSVKAQGQEMKRCNDQRLRAEKLSEEKAQLREQNEELQKAIAVKNDALATAQEELNKAMDLAEQNASKVKEAEKILATKDDCVMQMVHMRQELNQKKETIEHLKIEISENKEAANLLMSEANATTRGTKRQLDEEMLAHSKTWKKLEDCRGALDSVRNVISAAMDSDDKGKGGKGKGGKGKGKGKAK